jgi:hypothetical protein
MPLADRKSGAIHSSEPDEFSDDLRHEITRGSQGEREDLKESPGSLVPGRAARRIPAAGAVI